MTVTEQGSTASSETETHSFVVRIWAESQDETDARWRGWVENVEDGERRYFQDMGEISRILSNHLSGMVGQQQ